MDQATINALRIVEYLKVGIPVAKGSAAPLKVKRVDATDFHGKDGLGNCNLPAPTLKAEEDGVEFIARKIEEENIKIIIATGPLTNIAKAFREYRKAIETIDELVIMGGSILGRGNISCFAEFNFYADPHAADYVLKQNVNKTLVPLDVTRCVVFTPKHLEYLRDSRTARLAKDIVPVYQNNYIEKEGLGGNPLHDPLAVGYVIENSFLKTQTMGVSVRTDSSPHIGECVVEGIPNINVALQVESERFLRYFTDTIQR